MITYLTIGVIISLVILLIRTLIFPEDFAGGDVSFGIGVLIGCAINAVIWPLSIGFLIHDIIIHR